jgi:hypothetical protein
VEQKLKAAQAGVEPSDPGGAELAATTEKALAVLATSDLKTFQEKAEAVVKAASAELQAATKAVADATAALDKADERLEQAKRAEAGRKSLGGLEAKGLVSASALELVVPISDDAALRKVTVRFTRAAPNDAVISAGSPIPAPLTKLYELKVTRARYYFDVGVLVAFFPWSDGTYRASASAIPGTEVRRVTVDKGADPRAAIALNVYPFGRRRGEISSLHGCGSASECIGETLGVQVGTNLNFDKIEREAFYLGLLFEPVGGFALNFGVAWLRTDRLQAGWGDGTLLVPGDEIAKATRLVPSGYFGFTISTEVFSTARTIAAGIR